MAHEYTWDEVCPYIREAGMQRMDSWRAMHRRIFDHQFLYCISGIAYAALGGRTYPVKAGDLLIFPPNTPHQLWMDEKDPGEMYWFHCDFFLMDDRKWILDFYNDTDRYITLFGAEMPCKEHVRENPVFEGGYVLPVHTTLQDTESMEYAFRAIYRAYVFQSKSWQAQARSFFWQIISQLLAQSTGDSDREMKRAYIVNQIKAYVGKHYFEPMSVEGICEDTGLNTEYASKLFRKETGMTVVEYVNRFRVGQAKKLLIDRDLSIVDVAEMVGFSNENYFGSITKKYEGKTPARLRAHLLNLMADEVNMSV